MNKLLTARQAVEQMKNPAASSGDPTRYALLACGRAEIYFTGGGHTSFVLLHNSHSQKNSTAGFYRGV